MNEQELQGVLIQWTTQAAAEEPGLVIGDMRQEQPRPRRGLMATRRDVVLRDRAGHPVASGEIRFADAVGGATPDAFDLVNDAHGKAADLGVRFFFTWNINDAILWTTDDVTGTGLGLMDRRHRVWSVVDLPARSLRQDIEQPQTLASLQQWWRSFLRSLSDVLSGRTQATVLPLDEQFVSMLEVALKPLIGDVRNGIYRDYHVDPRFARTLRRWMISEQQWTFEPANQMETEGVDAAARLSSYSLLVQLVFYEALRRNFPELSELLPPAGVQTAGELASHLRARLLHAQRVSGNYEVVLEFGFAEGLALLNDDSVAGWRTLLAGIDRYDFTRLPYEVIGLIFQRLISPEERHRYGQYYTKPAIVDLMHGFCLKDASAIYLDPACGGGTFPVRAYARKQYLRPKATHQELLESIWATDLARFAAKLTTVNLCKNDIARRDNFPLVAQRDFFDVTPGTELVGTPRPLSHLRAVRVRDGRSYYALGEVDVIASNLPYVRQENVDKAKIAGVLHVDWHGRVPEHSKRSDLHVYFWLHAWQFLRNHGYFAFLTSTAWLETLYGFHLQRFLLDRFAIRIVAEAKLEPWFSDARVGTVCTIAQREDDSASRDRNVVRFVSFLQPLDALLPTTRDENARQEAVDRLVRDIEAVHADTEEARWRIRVVSQAELRMAGAAVRMLPPDGDDDDAPGLENP